MTRMNSPTKPTGTRGFSLVELMVVAAIVLIVAAVAIPNILQGMRFLRLRSNATNIATLLQQARMRSVRDNRSYQLLFAAVAPGTNILFVDGTAGPASFNGALDRGEPYTVLARDVALPNAPPAGAPNAFIEAAMSPGVPLGQTALVISSSLATAPAFNPRGIPCQVAGGGLSSPTTACNTIAAGGGGQPIAYVIYLQSTTVPIDGWSAVTISPGGRVRTWVFAPGTPNRWR